ncbi:MAG TPA: LysR family transcriptional regulator [Flavobacteriaceae bacterium]|nr:LysR family transcriptional regulator [Flavobacteriaceae bacterium]HIP26672.1 LysR family transcriptional regulator [Flavobacteriaceae bacterium]
MNTKYSISYRFWITQGNEPFLGKGRVELLLKIQEFGSLKKASEALKMSYRKAYYAISHVNKIAEKPLVIIKRGGKNGGSSELTLHGIELIERFKKLSKEFDEFTNSKEL